MGSHDQLLIKIALEKGIVKQPQIKKALDLHSSQTFKQHLGEKPKAIDQILLERGFITQKQLNQLREEVKKHLLAELTRAGEQIRRCGRCRVRFVGKPEELAPVDSCPVCQQTTEPEAEPESLEGLVKAEYALVLKSLDLQTRAALGNNGTIARRYLKVTRSGANETAEVWKCRDLATRTDVMIKLFRLTPPSETVAQYKLQQGKLRTLQNPFIAAVLDSGTDQGQLYVATEFAEGMPLSEIQQLETDKVLDIFGMICEGLQTAHDKGIYHLNLKPSNIIVDKNGSPKIVDFGTLRQTTVQTGTASQTIYGSIPYLAPEQVAGQVKEWDGLTDVYGLGASLYFCLTGQPPFETVETGELIRNVMQGQPKDPRLINSSIPEDCQRIIKRAMAKLKPFRYPKPMTMAKDIRQYLEGKGLRDSYTVMNVKLTDVLEESKKITGPISGSQARIISPISVRPVLEMFLWLFALPGLLVLSASGLVALGASRLSSVVSVSFSFEGPLAPVAAGAAGACVVFSLYFLFRRVRSRSYSRSAGWAFLVAGLGMGMLGVLAGIGALMARRMPRLGLARQVGLIVLAGVYLAAGWMTLSNLGDDGALTREDLGALGVASLVVLAGAGALLAFTPNRSAVKLPGLPGAAWAIGIGLAVGVGWIAFFKGFVAEDPAIGPALPAATRSASRTLKTRELRGLVVPRAADAAALIAAAKAAGLDFVALPKGSARAAGAEIAVVELERVPDYPKDMAVRGLRTLVLGIVNPELWWLPLAETMSTAAGPTPAATSLALGPFVADLRGGLARGARVHARITGAQTLADAFAEGRTIAAWQSPGDAKDFEFGGVAFAIGDRAPMVPEEISIRLPADGVGVIYRGEAPVGHFEGREYFFEATEPGAYHVRVYARVGGRLVPWIQSGPIRVGKTP